MNTKSLADMSIVNAIFMFSQDIREILRFILCTSPRINNNIVNSGICLFYGELGAPKVERPGRCRPQNWFPEIK